MSRTSHQLAYRRSQKRIDRDRREFIKNIVLFTFTGVMLMVFWLMVAHNIDIKVCSRVSPAEYVSLHCDEVMGSQR